MRATGREWLITIRRQTLTYDEKNRPVEVWSDLAQAWAEKRDVSDGERFRAQQVEAQITSRFLLLWSPQLADVDAKDRIVVDGRSYDISGVKEIGRRDGIEITAAARADT